MIESAYCRLNLLIMSKQKRRSQICVSAESQTQKAALLLFARQFFHHRAYYWTLPRLRRALEPGWWEKWKYSLNLIWIQYLATTARPSNTWVMEKEWGGNEIMAIAKEFFWAWLHTTLFKIKILIIAILQPNPEYNYFIQKRSWQATNMKIRANTEYLGKQGSS